MAYCYADSVTLYLKNIMCLGSSCLATKLDKHSKKGVQPQGRTTEYISKIITKLVKPWCCVSFLYALNFDAEPHDQPENNTLKLRITESDTLYIPCVPAVGMLNVSVWSIDGALYPFTRLRPNHIQHFGGIILYHASQQITGSRYRCYRTVNNYLELLYTVDVDLFQSQKCKLLTVLLSCMHETLQQSCYSYW